ncbi:MAG: CPBP family intramembrane glutamic endopeptidase [Planctomycetota bacterium]
MKRIPLILLSVFCLLPSVQSAVAVYFQWHTPVTYPLLKAVMIAIPVIVWLKLRSRGVDIRQRAGWKRPGVVRGLWVGVLMGAVVLVGYYAVLRGRIETGGLLAKVRSLGLLEYYWVMAIFVSLFNSLFEEYYWRAFIIGELRAWSRSTLLLCVAGGGGFGLHHLFVTLGLFEWPVVLMCVLGTMVAGAVWSWMRVRGASVIDCYISHVLADLAVLWVGYDLVTKA